MKNKAQLTTLLLLICLGLKLFGQQSSNSDFGRIVLNTWVPDSSAIPLESKQLLETKLAAIAAENGVGGRAISPRFLLYAKGNVITKDIVPGTTPMIAQQIELTYFIGDAIDNRIFSTLTISQKGVGTNIEKSWIDAIRKINPKDPRFSVFVSAGKQKILDYYNMECNRILSRATMLNKMGKYDEAIYELSVIPTECSVCYQKSLDTCAWIYQNKIDKEAESKLQLAKSEWSKAPNKSGADKAAEIINTIAPGSNQQGGIDSLLADIRKKISEIDKREFDLKVKQHEDAVALEKERMAQAAKAHEDEVALNKSKMEADREKNAQQVELEKLRIQSYSEVALEFAKNQPKTVNYNNIRW